MKRAVFIIGAAVGYVLGARAGRERYELIKAKAKEFAAHPAVRSAAGSVRQQAGEVGGKAAHIAGEAGSKAAHRCGELAQEGWHRTEEMAGAARKRVNERRHKDSEEEMLTM